jgi:PhzF family phenazine biosynthesis protein
MEIPVSLPLYQVDAFAAGIFKGNPAAVMPLPAWLDDSLLQLIAMENNLSETAYIVEAPGGYELRWFTPQVEVDLCGHATLAAAHVLFEHLSHTGEEILFYTRSGELRVRRAGTRLTLDFPATDLVSTDVDLAICKALGATASEALEPTGGSGPLLYVYEFHQDVGDLEPDFAALLSATSRNIIACAPGDDCDVVSRFFGPGVGINEDPVTGSAHCSLVPYWAARLRKTQLQCRQISARGGDLDCELRDGRVFMTGSAVTFMQGFVEGIES